MQQRHTGAKKVLFSNLHICRQNHSASPISLPPVGRMRYTEQASSHADNRILADADRTLWRMCDVAITVDEAGRVNVHILAVVEMDWPLDHGGEGSVGIIAAFARADNAMC